jgi:AraC family transcriptional regulator
MPQATRAPGSRFQKRVLYCRVAAVRTLCEGEHVTVRDIACRAPRGGPGETRGGEGTHLVFVRRGAFVAHLGARAYVADPCTAVVSWADTEYRLAHPGIHGDDCTVLELAPATADELLHRHRARRDIEIPIAPAVQLRYARLLATTTMIPGVIEEVALELANVTLACGDGIVGPPHVRRVLVRRVRELLDADPTVTWSVGELAAAVGVSPHHLMRVFRRETGMTLRAYRIQLRLALAVHRVLASRCDLAALAAELGFASHAHLTDTFTRCLGTSPRELRARPAGLDRSP